MKKTLYPSIVTIGIFDGVHKGHQAILKKVIRRAKIARLKSVVITFDPHPVKVLSPGAEIPLLMSLEHRIRLIKKMGVDECLVMRFTKGFSKLSPEDFIKNVLTDKLNLKVLVTGGNFLFGFKEKGGVALLRRLSGTYGFKFYSVPPLKMKPTRSEALSSLGGILSPPLVPVAGECMDGNFISSTRIRRLIEEGDLKSASKMLGRPVTILGTVVKGRSLGRKIGFPTANIDPHHESIPPAGVYSVDAALGEKKYRGILNISGRKIIEVHIFNFKKDIYGKDIEVIFRQKIRDEKKFKSLEALKKQIRLDILNSAS